MASTGPVRPLVLTGVRTVRQMMNLRGAARCLHYTPGTNLNMTPLSRERTPLLHPSPSQQWFNPRTCSYINWDQFNHRNHTTLFSHHRLHFHNTCRHFTGQNPSPNPPGPPPPLLPHRRYSAAQLVESVPPVLRPYLKLMRFDRPVGTLLVMWPGLCSLALAADPGCFPDPVMMAKFSLGAFLMRGAGCTINDMWDKEIDKMVERTKLRPLAAGDLTPEQALAFLAVQLSTALALLLSLNWYTVCVGAMSVVFVAFYPVMKRITYWPQLFLGIPHAWGALMGWPAVRAGADWSVVAPLYAACILWTMTFDTIYSHQDKLDDCKIGVKSLALRLGDETKHWLTGFSLAMCGCLTLAGVNNHMTWPYYVTVGVVAGHLTRQIVTLDINDSDNCFERFYSNIRLGFILFTGIVAANLLKQSDTLEEPYTPLNNTDPSNTVT